MSTEIQEQAEAEEGFDLLMRQVMKEHVRSDVPLGLFLSGGNDSASIATSALSVHGYGY